MKIAILTLAQIPEGLAPSNRVLYHAKGLKANGADVKIFVVKPTEISSWENIKNTEPEGLFGGIPYEYINGRTIRSKHFLKRRIDDIFGPLKAAFRVIRDKYDCALLISSNSFYHVTIFKLIFKLYGKTFIAERTELPFHGKKSHGLYKIKNMIYSKFIYKSLDGFIVISTFLNEYYRKFVSRKCPILLIPVIVEVDDIYRAKTERTRNLVYTGPLLQKKDGILTILESFANIMEEFPETNLIMTGNLQKSEDRDKILALIEKHSLSERIKFTGFISRDEMIDYLNSAAALVLAKPSSDQADSCFPTKLGEYLATRNPIVVTETGEIPNYLKDEVSAYIAKPDSVEDFTSKLRDVLKDPEKSRKVGEEGAKVAEKSFSFIESGKKVLEFIDNVKKGRRNTK